MIKYSHLLFSVLKEKKIRLEGWSVSYIACGGAVGDGVRGGVGTTHKKNYMALNRSENKVFPRKQRGTSRDRVGQ